MIIHLKTILLCLFGAVAFGIIHDLITANLCVEYFTIGHPEVIDSKNPFLLALVWGVIATWWVGAILGILVVIFNHVGKYRKVSFLIIKRYVFRLFLIMLLTPLLAGLMGYLLAETNSIHLIDALAERIPAEKHDVFLAVGWAHVTSYLVGLIGGIVICMKIWMQRTNPARKVKTDKF